MVAIRVEDVWKSYGENHVLEGVTFEVPDGEFAVLLGPSGCGKTTLLRCVAGLEKVHRGRIYLGGELANDLPPVERDIAMVFQGFSLFPTMTVRENIAFPLRIRDVAKAEVEERVGEVAETLSIEHLLDKSPKEISGGEQQRVAIGRAISRRPRAFLMDEPLSNLDAPLRAQLRSELKRIQREIRVTTLYVTHDQAEAHALADKIGVLNRGSLLQYGPPNTVFENPSSAFVARFVGDPQTNILSVSLTSPGRGTAFAAEGGGISLPVPEAVGRALEQTATQGDAGGDARRLHMSIRPEDIQLSLSPQPGDYVQGTVALDEPLTLYRLVTVRPGEGPDGVRVLASKDLKLEVGQKVWLRFDAGKIRFFDPDTGRLLV